MEITGVMLQFSKQFEQLSAFSLSNSELTCKRKYTRQLSENYTYNWKN